MNSIISTKRLSKSFVNGTKTQTIIANMDLEINDGDFTVIMGPSGAGKSTLLYALSGMDRPNSGEVWFGDTNITKLSEDQLAVFRRKNCGFVFQQIYLLDKMSLLDNVLVAGLLVEHDKGELAKRAKGLFKKNLSADTYSNRVSKVSGGEAQRAGIVRAIINQPRVVFADEPTGALNSSNSQAVLDILSSLNDGGQCIVMVTHDKKSALRGNRILYLKDGKICGECNLPKYKKDEKTREKALNKFLSDMEW